MLLALTIGARVEAVSPALTASVLRLTAVAPDMIPNVVHQLAEGVIREMTTTFKTVAVLTLLGALGLAAGFAVRAATPDPPAPSPTPVQFVAAEQPEPTPKIPDCAAGQGGRPEGARTGNLRGQNGDDRLRGRDQEQTGRGL